MSKSLLNMIEKVASASTKSIGNILEEVFDRVSAIGYTLQRGDLNYQKIPPKLMKNLDSHVLEKLVAIDQVILRLLKEYGMGMNPNLVDPEILYSREVFLQEVNSRMQFIKDCIINKISDPKRVLKKHYNSVLKLQEVDELGKSFLNVKYKNVMIFLNGFLEGITEEHYVDQDTKGMIIKMIDKLYNLSEKQAQCRLNHMKNLREKVESLRNPR